MLRSLSRNSQHISRRFKSTVSGEGINFNDSQVAFKSKTIGELVRAHLVFSICQIRPLVAHSESLMRFSYKVLGNKVADALLRNTFFGHFCAGEDEMRIKPVVDYLQRNGIGSILDYAAEADVEEAPPTTNSPQSSSPPSSSSSSSSSSILTENQCRVYEYKDEALCDMHAETFEKCIHAVKKVSPTGFAAIKCTALGNPKLLERMSTAITELRKLFLKFDTNNTGYVSREQFQEAYNKFFKDGGDAGSAARVFDSIDVDHDGKVDYIEWSNALPLENLGSLVSQCREQGPLSRASLDENEVALVKKMRERIHKLASLAKSLGVRVMIDAEHTYFQPAIDNITIDLAKKYNTDYPVIFSTYQMYLTDSKQRLRTDMERARKGDYKFAAKLVRGAYMVLERARAKELGIDDPINPTLQATHDNYNSAVHEVIAEMARIDALKKSGKHTGNYSVEVMIASHNQNSVEQTLAIMKQYGLTPEASVYFGQLLGMSDHLSFSLGNAGYKAYKYVPYGKVNEVMPYLIRRAQENSGALSGAKVELGMLKTEIKRRIFGSSKK